MRKIALLILILFNVFSVLAVEDSGYFYLDNKISLINNHLKKRTTNLESLLYANWCSVTETDKGQIFISSKKQHKITIIGKDVNFIKSFGRKGAGPGDLQSPGILSILDNKYLIIGESLFLRRFSVFDLNGKFVKVVKTPRACANPIALKDGYIAYYAREWSYNAKTRKCKIVIYIKNIWHLKEKKIFETDIDLKNRIKLPNNYSVSFALQTGEVFYRSSADGNLIIGKSDNPVISILSLDGKLVRKVKISGTINKVDSEYVKAFKQSIINSYGEEHANSNEVKAIRKTDFSIMFNKTLPLYKEMKTDREGNLLFLKWNKDFSDNRKIICAYSDKGKFLGQFEFIEGSYNSTFHNSLFSKNSITCLVTNKEDEEEIPELLKIIAVP